MLIIFLRTIVHLYITLVKKIQIQRVGINRVMPVITAQPFRILTRKTLIAMELVIFAIQILIMMVNIYLSNMYCLRLLNKL